MIGCLIEDPSPRPFFDFIVLYVSPGKGAGRVQKRVWGKVLSFELGAAVGVVGLVFGFSVRMFCPRLLRSFV